MATKDVGNLRTRLSWEDEGATRSLTGFRQDLKSLRSEMNLAKSGSKEYSQSLKGLREQSDILTRRFKTQQEQVKELRKRYEESRQTKGEDAKQTRNLADQYRNTVAQMNRTEQQLNKVTEAIEAQTNPWKKLSRNLDDAGTKMQTIGQSMTDFGRDYSLKVTAPIIAGSGAVFKAAMDFETAFTGVEKTVDATSEQMKSLRENIRDMAKEIPASTTEIAGVAEAAGQLGIEVENIEDFTRTMIDLGESTNLSANQAATEFARFANIVGMSQDDFDRLGSTIVGLGNNLATTESEISSMALRLAGAGAQIGLTEAETLSFAAALSSVGIEAEAGGSSFSKVMVEMQLAAERGGDSLEAFAKVAGVSSGDFKKAFEQDATKAIMMFIEGLSSAEERGLSAIGILDEMGITEIRMRDALLRAAGASDVFTNAINIGSKAWEENTALTEEAEKRYGTTASELRIMWNRVKDVAISLGESLAPAVMDALDAAEPLIQKIEDGAQAFSEMSEEEQRTILKMIAMAAAIGPVSVGLGGLITTIGGLSKGIGGVANLLGKSKGSGLLGRLGMLGLGGPVGLAVAGVGALGIGIYNLTKEKEKLHDINYDIIENMSTEIEATDQLINRFDELQSYNKLSNAEMLRYMDILSELESAKGEEAIKKLKDEQADLLEKSGFTNAEMEEFLGLNDKVIEKSPDTTKAISDQGNAYAENTSALKDLNREKREELLINAERELLNAVENENEHLKDQKELIKEIKQAEKDIAENRSSRLDITDQLRNEEQKLRDLQEELLGFEQDGTVESNAKWLSLRSQVDSQSRLVAELETEKSLLENTYEKLVDKLNTKNDDLDVTKEELAKIEALKYDYEQLILSQADVTAEKGRGLTKVNEEISRLEVLKAQLNEARENGELNTAEYEDQVAAIDEQLGRLRTAQGELEVINELAGQTVYKDVNIQEHPSNFWETLNRELGKEVTKRVRIMTAKGLAEDLGWYAEGTDHHPGGKFIAGEEGYELGRLGNKWELLNYGMYDRPTGYQVFTHDESKKILNSINRLPGYASGARPIGEADKILSRLNQPSTNDYRTINISVDAGNIMELQRIIELFTGLKQAQNAH
ncbi:TP901 family phage tail tape measure protein [Salirhabdus euzebyi]|uniref:TP901 family phage tail tape measure protein n=1 Tax=Salirhabdus euzebyi TaxID=394506 RepID=A0A841PYF5_9BACI|nr:phage tail tape measure protein [Salirhabdus euzebyi]MBB6451981.1 TP901 family phage tail tape measure protein [Salirhabdus euzebyi]